MCLKIVLLTITVACAVTMGQGNRRTSPILPSQGGSVEITVNPLDAISSLEDMAAKADLIVQGSVERVLPSRFRDPSLPGTIETDSLFAIQSVLSGEDRSPNGRILISQMGGTSGDFVATVPQDTLLSEGQEYFLFLDRETRDLPNSTGAPRYIISGVWKGKVPVAKVSGRAAFSLAPNDAPNRDATLSQFEVEEFATRAKAAALAKGVIVPRQ
ncbi:MAG: hypothetical protein O3A53_07775 [Acidobacteria bacterium]|nr:hypothetical protein [Acidobacteriota bacterium]MDA1234684.1 hypothetical protein [Acidobacteriota bacterium]